MEDGIQRDPAGAPLGQRFTRVRVDMNAGEVAAGNIEPVSVPASKDQGSRIQPDS